MLKRQTNAVAKLLKRIRAFVIVAIAHAFLLLPLSSDAAVYSYRSSGSVPEGWILSPSEGGSAQMYLIQDPAVHVPVLLYEGQISISFSSDQVWKTNAPALLVSDKRSQYSISWTMKTGSSFSYAFHVDTDEGVRTLEYVDQPKVSTSANRKKSQIALGLITTKNNWVRVQKNLWRDFTEHFPNLEPHTVIGVDIKGTGLINHLYVENTRVPDSVVIAKLEITNPKATDEQARLAATTSLTQPPSVPEIQNPGPSTALRAPQNESDVNPVIDSKHWSITSHLMNSRTSFTDSSIPQNDENTVGLNASYRYDNRYFALLAIKPDLSTLTNDFDDDGASVTDDAKPDPRSFFKESAELFGNDTDYFYSLRIPDIDNGVKTYAQLGDFEFALLATTSPEERNDSHLRLNYDFLKNSNLSMDFVSSNQSDLDHQFVGTTLQSTFDNNLYTVLKASTTQNTFTDFSGDTTVENDADQDSLSNAASAELGWSGDALSVSVQADRYSRGYFAPNTLLDPSIAGTQGTELGVSLFKDGAGQINNIFADVSVNHRTTIDGERQTLGAFAGLGVEISNYARANIQYNNARYTPSDGSLGGFSETELSDDFWNLDVDLNIDSARFGYGFSLSNGILADEDYDYYSAYSWFFPTQSVSVSVFTERLQFFGDFRQNSLKTTWEINNRQSLLGKYSTGNDFKIWKLAYSHKFTRQLEMVLAYQQLVDFTDEIAGKFSWTFL